MATYNVTLDQAWRMASKLSQAQNELGEVLACISAAQTAVDEVFGAGKIALLSAQEQAAMEALQQRWATRIAQVRTAMFVLEVG